MPEPAVAVLALPPVGPAGRPLPASAGPNKDHRTTQGRTPASDQGTTGVPSTERIPMGAIKSGAKVLGMSAGVFAAASALVFGLAVYAVFFSGWVTDVTADRAGETEKKQLVEGSGSFRISAYDHFFDLCTTIQGQEATIASLGQELDANPSEARREQILATLTTLRAQRAQNIAQYNNDGAKDYTAGQFRDSDLPYPLNPNQEATTCTY
jgi:hypothetical protein